jgi:HEAT repeat protein
MAALLKATDVNLRITAAQALGKTKQPEAAQPLLAAVGDPDEIVACTALAAIEEAHANDRDSSAEKTALPELVTALKPALADPRWRVRATAAEVAGKMRLLELAAEVKKLLEDTDGFVVKNALVASKGLGAAPPAPQLAEIAKRLPALRADAVELMIEKNADDTVKIVLDMFDRGGFDDRVAILNALARNESSDHKAANDPWKPLLARAAAVPDPPVRRLAAEVLGMRPLKSAAELVGPLLEDPDVDTRGAAADVVLGIIAGKRRVVSRMGMPMQVFSDEEMLLEQRSSSRRAKTNQPYATAAQLAAWHSSLTGRSGDLPDIRAAIALFATGDKTNDLPIVRAAVERLDAGSIRKLAGSPAGVVLVRKLPWPDGKPVLEKLCAWPSLFALAATEHGQAAPEVGAFLLEPARFKAAVEPAAGVELPQRLLGGSDYYSEERRGWSLLAPDERTGAVVLALLGSTNAAWRAAAVYALAQGESEKHDSVFQRALEDPNPFVRAAAVQGLAGTLKDRSQLEARLGPLLGDTNSTLAQMAAVALLDPELRESAGLQTWLKYFVFDKARLSTRSTFYSEPRDDRPLIVREGSPAFLDQARSRLKSPTPGEIGVFALLLAQYGQFDGLEALAAHLPAETRERAVFSPPRSSPSKQSLTAWANRR